MRLFAFSTLVFCLACVCGGGAEEDTGSSRRRRNTDDDTATDTADTGTTDTGGTDTGGNDTGTTDTGTTDTGGNDTGSSGATDADRDGWTLAEGDCDDANRSINPAMDEVCNGEDDDCDFMVDEDNVCGSAEVRVQLSFGGQFQATRSTYTSGKVGYAYVNDAGVATCTVYGSLTRTGAAPTGCPSCEWSFDLSAAGTATPTGSGCADMTGFGYAPADLASYVAGAFDYSWGFATTTTYSGVTVNHAIFFNDGSTWQLFSSDEYGGNWSGSSSNFTFNRALQDGSFYYYYTP